MHDPTNLSKLPYLKALTPAAMQAFEAFDRAAMSPGAIPRRYKELIAVAVAVAARCPYTMEIHRASATNAGVTEAEFAEAIFIASAMSASSMIAHGTHLVAKKPGK